MKFDESLKMDAESGIFASIQNQFKYVSRERVKRGQTLFEFNSSTGDIIPAVVLQEKGSTDLKGKLIAGTKRVNKKKDCVYFWALNQRNAERKIKQAVLEYQTKTKSL